MNANEAIEERTKSGRLGNELERRQLMSLLKSEALPGKEWTGPLRKSDTDDD